MHRECAVEECTDMPKARGWCNAHYIRWARYGDPNADVRYRPRVAPRGCAVTDCERIHAGHGYCGMHMRRFNNHGNTDRLRWRQTNTEIHYITAHSRLRSALGRAATRACAACGQQARDWSYKGNAPDEMISPNGLPYSADFDYYEPLCSKCHRKRDWVDKKTSCKWGHEFTEDNTATDKHQRRCRACDRRKNQAKKAREAAK